MTDELRFSTELKLWKYKIERIARRFGLDFYPIMYIIVTPQEMSEIVARHGFPTTPHHWRYGQESLWWKKRFRFGLGRIYELVLNTVPAYAYLLQLNDVITQKAVMAHVCGHVDMNKNNAYFRPTNRNMVNAMASDALRVEKMFELVGRDRVKEFYDFILSFEWFIDQNSLYIKRRPPLKSEEERTKDREERKIPKRIEPREELPGYMDEFLNPPEWIDEERARLSEELQEEADIERGAIIPPEPTKDILGFFMRYAPLESWQKELIAMIRRHSYYFAPMGRTKLMHEGWATLWEEEIMTEAGMISSSELTQFSEELAGVQRKHGGINPYRLGYEIWKDIKFRWDTGRHGTIWDECQYRQVKERWEEFAVFKTIADKIDLNSDEFWKQWNEFSSFVEELKAGNLGYPREIFIRNQWTKEYLIPVWLRYQNRQLQWQKNSQIREEMEPLELEAALLAKELEKLSPDTAEEELKMKARHDIYERAGRMDLWLLTPDDLKQEEGALSPLISFDERFKNGETNYPAIPIPEEWPEWAVKCCDEFCLGIGNEKIFEVRSTYDDLMFLEEFFTKDFCEEKQYFFYKAKQVWDYQTYTQRKRYVIESRSFRRIKKRLLFQYTNFYLPVIRIEDANFDNNGELYLVHEHQGVDLDFWSKDEMYMKDVLRRLFKMWGGKKLVHLETIITQKEEEKDWWFTWHQTEEKEVEDEDRELTGNRVIFSYGLKEDDESEEEMVKTDLEEVFFKAPF
ncbi:MAG TPA: SpoVR family protein [Candidatus Paceibacterota bacterium]